MIVKADLGRDRVRGRNPMDGRLHLAPVRGVAALRCRIVRASQLDDIAGAVEFLATAPYVTGQIIAVDGGRSIVL
jgi:NAD(P)-dependent dehydrogenase (short-subunit alcohol dehydrogenase family)